jgi:hypothetical protein
MDVEWNHLQKLRLVYQQDLIPMRYWEPAGTMLAFDSASKRELVAAL